MIFNINIYINIFIFIFIFWRGFLYVKSFFDNSEITGERDWKYFRSCIIWNLFKKYFQFTVKYINKEEIDLIKGACILGAHPHGFACIATGLGFALYGSNNKIIITEEKKEKEKEDIFCKQVHILSANVCFRIPFVRDFFLWLGSVKAERKVIKTMLRNNKKICINVGGISELIETKYNELTINEKRRGFCQIAFEQKIPLIPVYSSGENKTFYFFNPSFMKKYYYFIYKLIGYPIPLFLFGPLPTKVTLIIGNPIDPTQCEDWKELKSKFYNSLHLMIKTEDGEEKEEKKLFKKKNKI